MTESTVSAGLAKALMDVAVSKGASRRELLERSRICLKDLLDQDNRVPMTSYIALMRAGKELCDAPALALEFCEDTRFEKLSIVGLICQSAQTMGEALKQLNRFSRLVVEVDGLGIEDRFQLSRRDGGMWLEDTRPAPNRFPELTEATFARFICETNRHFGDMPFVKLIHVTHPKPDHSAAYARILKVPVIFGSDRNAMLIHESWLSTKLHGPNRYVFGIFSERAQTLLNGLENSKTAKGRVECLMIPLLHTGDLSMGVIAAKMNLSRQALYRELKAEGVTFERVRDDLRYKMALNYISGEKLSASETAYLVGFSEPSAFSRAFKRWSGRSSRRP